MGSTHALLTPSIIAKEALMLLKNNLVFGAKVHRKYKEEFKKVGESITIRKPVKFKVTKARTRATSTITEKSITLTVATQAHVSWGFSTVDLTLTIEQYAERYLNNAVAAIANTIDEDLAALYKDVFNTVWESTGYVDPHSFIVLGKCAQKLDEESVPPEDRCLVLNPAANWSMANALRTVYVTDIAKTAIRKGYLATIAGMEIFMDQNIQSHQAGEWGTTSGGDGTGVEVATGVASAGATGTSAIALADFDIVSTKVLVVGDVFTIANVYAVNNMSGASTGQLRQFVVTAEASCGSTGTTTEVPITVSIDPPMIDTGPYKTIDTMPAGGAAVDVVGQVIKQTPQNLAFHKNAFALVVVPLEIPDGASFSARATDKDTGLSVRVLKWYDGDADVEYIRLDVLYGVKTLYPELACRLMGAQV